MSVKKNRPTREQAANALVQAMVKELDVDQEQGALDAPEIVEDYQAFSDRFSVRVIWDKWQNVPPAERVPMILEAYRLSSRKDEVPNITAARGLTYAEAKYEETVGRMIGGTHDIIQRALRNI